MLAPSTYSAMTAVDCTPLALALRDFAAPIDCLDANIASLRSIYDGYLRLNLPFVISNSCHEWHSLISACNSDARIPVLSTFASRFHESTTVPVVRQPTTVDGGGGDLGYGGGDRRDEWLQDYLRALANGSTSAEIGYLKDWHFVRDAPSAASSLYFVPLPFCDDWLNSYFDARTVSMVRSSSTTQAASSLAPVAESGSAALAADTAPDDYRFCYVGPPGTSTPMHHDVLCSHSWSANVAGWKLWIFVAPGPHASGRLYNAWGDIVTRSLLDVGLRQQIRDACVTIFGVTGAAMFASLPPSSDTRDTAERAIGRDHIRYCIQPPGSIVFVPSGWHHEVHNLGPPPAIISINHNWFAGHALDRVWAFLSRELAAVRRSIADCKSASTSGIDVAWEITCQRVLKTNSALNYVDLGSILLYQSQRLLQHARFVTGDAPLPAGRILVGDDDAEEPLSRLQHRVRSIAPLKAPHVLVMPPWWILDSLQAVSGRLRLVRAGRLVMLENERCEAWRNRCRSMQRQGSAMRTAIPASMPSRWRMHACRCVPL